MLTFLHKPMTYVLLATITATVLASDPKGQTKLTVATLQPAKRPVMAAPTSTTINHSSTVGGLSVSYITALTGAQPTQPVSSTALPTQQDMGGTTVASRPSSPACTATSPRAAAGASTILHSSGTELTGMQPTQTASSKVLPTQQSIEVATAASRPSSPAYTATSPRAAAGAGTTSRTSDAEPSTPNSTSSNNMASFIDVSTADNLSSSSRASAFKTSTLQVGPRFSVLPNGGEQIDYTKEVPQFGGYKVDYTSPIKFRGVHGDIKTASYSKVWALGDIICTNTSLAQRITKTSKPRADDAERLISYLESAPNSVDPITQAQAIRHIAATGTVIKPDLWGNANRMMTTAKKTKAAKLVAKIRLLGAELELLKLAEVDTVCAFGTQNRTACASPLGNYGAPEDDEVTKLQKIVAQAFNLTDEASHRAERK